MVVKKICKAVFRSLKKIKNIPELPDQIKISSMWNKRHDFYLPFQAFGCSKKTYESQIIQLFPKQIKFSILVPLYNTPENFLKEMIASVLFQTYQNWELCLADGSDSNHDYVKKICQEISSKDPRIKYQKLEKNGGISENTNACIKMASGDYISLFDHDDLLHPCALYETMKAICEKDADFVYTDEVTFYSPKINHIASTNFKPDFSSDYFLAINYICHFTSFKKEFIDVVGGYDSKTDGAQDFDLFLRITEKAKNITHISKCLYYWRASPTSTASGFGAKTYAQEAGRLAVEKALKRRGIDAQASTYRQDFVYKTSYTIKDTPKISIIIPNLNNKEIALCIESIIKNTSYSNYEIIVVDYTKLNKSEGNVQLLPWSNEINIAAMNNYGAENASGDYLLFLESNTKVISQNWLQELLMFAQRENTGLVSGKLYYEDGRVYNTGLALGVKGGFEYLNKGLANVENGFGFTSVVVHNLSAVSSGCLMTSKKVFEKLKGFTTELKNSFYEIDFCIRLRKENLLIVWTPFAELCHLKNHALSKTQTKKDKKLLLKKWKDELQKQDPYYNNTKICFPE